MASLFKQFRHLKRNHPVLHDEKPVQAQVAEIEEKGECAESEGKSEVAIVVIYVTLKVKAY